MGKPTGFIEYLRELPLDRLVDESFAQDANRALGPFRLAPAPASKAGCGK